MLIYHIYVTSPKEKDMGYNDETEELVKLLDAPVMDPGSWVSHWDADYTEAQYFAFSKLKTYQPETISTAHDDSDWGFPHHQQTGQLDK